MKPILNFILFIFMVASMSLHTQAQREKNNIYLFDCTGSMISNKLWEPAKTSLDETLKLDATIPGSHVTIIPFGDEPYEVFSFDAKDYNSKSKGIFSSFDKYIKQAKYTHISDVVEKGLGHVDPSQDNRIFLLTDGEPNHNDSPDKVAETISRWCLSHKNTRFFYVALTKGALDSKIRKALEDCPDAYPVELEGNVIPCFVDLSSNVYTNLEELSKPRQIEFSLPGTYEVKAEANNPYFDVKIEKNRAENGKILISLVPKQSLDDLHQQFKGQEYEFPVSITTTDRKFHVVNPVVTVHVADEIPSKLTLAQGEDVLSIPGAKWHDSFLWSPAAPDQTLTWNLAPVFENHLPDSEFKVKFQVPDGNKEDFKAWYNDSPIKNGEILTIKPEEKAVISIRFDHKAKTGKRYFELIPQHYNSLDMINSQPADEFGGVTLKSSYSKSWNPLGTAICWGVIGIIVLLVIWFLFLRRIFFPQIKLGKVEFTGPGSYYQSKKLKGARKVVLTSKKKKQNTLSKIFTGEVRYVKADHFSPEVEIVPASGKKKVRVRHSGKASPAWDIYPSSIFRQDDKGTIKNRNTNEETNMDFS